MLGTNMYGTQLEMYHHNMRLKLVLIYVLYTVSAIVHCASVHTNNESIKS
jgi:hypothetical protein